MSLKLLVLHGPNLNLLGEREPEIYGTLTLTEINQRLKKAAKTMSATLRIFQSNSEGELIDLLHQNRKWAQGVVFNPGAYTHYSYAIRDAVSAIQIPVIEVHLSDIKKREPFRRKSVIAPACLDQVSGLGWKSYLEGMKRLRTRIVGPLVMAWMALLLSRESHALSVDVVGGYALPGAAVTGSGVVAGGALPAISYGLLLDAGISSQLSLQFGALYAPRAFSVAVGAVASNYSTMAVHLPVLLRMSWLGIFSVGVGGYFSHSLTQGSWDVTPSGVKKMNQDDSGVVASVDMKIKLLPFLNAVVDGRYLIGFQNINQSSAFTAYVRDAQLWAGLRFGK